MNSGVLVYDKSIIDAFCPEAILDAVDLLFASFPHQTLTYYLAKAGGINLITIPKAFNSIPKLMIERSQEPLTYYIDNRHRVFIFHVTGAFKDRTKIISALDRANYTGLQIEVTPSLLRKIIDRSHT